MCATVLITFFPNEDGWTRLSAEQVPGEGTSPSPGEPPGGVAAVGRGGAEPHGGIRSRQGTRQPPPGPRRPEQEGQRPGGRLRRPWTGRVCPLLLSPHRGVKTNTGGRSDGGTCSLDTEPACSSGCQVEPHEMDRFWGACMAQSVKRPTSAPVMISRSVGSSPASGSVLAARSLEPASDSVSPSLSLPLPCLCSVSVSKMNKHQEKLKWPVFYPFGPKKWAFHLHQCV